MADRVSIPPTDDASCDCDRVAFKTEESINEAESSCTVDNSGANPPTVRFALRVALTIGSASAFLGRFGLTGSFVVDISNTLLGSAVWSTIEASRSRCTGVLDLDRRVVFLTVAKEGGLAVSSASLSLIMIDWSSRVGVFPRGDRLGVILTFGSGGGGCLSSGAGVVDLDRRVVFLTLDDEDEAATVSSLVSTMLTDWSNRLGTFPLGDRFGFISTVGSGGGGCCLLSEVCIGVFDLDLCVVFFPLGEGGTGAVSSLVAPLLTDWSRMGVGVFPLGERFGFVSTIGSDGDGCSLLSEEGSGVFDLDLRVVFFPLGEEDGIGVVSSVVGVFPLGERFGFILTVGSGGSCSSSEAGCSKLLNSATFSSPDLLAWDVSILSSKDVAPT